MERFFATCPRGLEQLLTQELQAFNADKIHAAGGGVGFSGDFTLCYRTNLESRIASRILWQVWAGRYRNEDDIYRAAYALRWTHWFDPVLTLRVDVTATGSPLRSLGYVTLKIKDAVCDKFRDLTRRRPSVNTRQPDVAIQGHLTDREFILYLDTTGDPLFKRGHRIAQGEAPLRENLAAGILRLAGWTPGTVLFDPMCGSGTFLLEAAQMALDIAPGSGRSFAFERLKNFDERFWRKLSEQSVARRKPKLALSLYGSDLSGEALQSAHANLAAAGLSHAVSLKRANVLEISAPARHGIIVTNPPYGIRLGEERELAEFYPKLGDVLKQRFSGWRAYLLSADMRLPKLIRLAASKRIPLFNGALDSRLFEYIMVDGEMTKKKGHSATPQGVRPRSR